MPSLTESAALAELVDLLYKFLPASGASVTFGTVAARCGVNEFWPPEAMSKAPRLRALVEGVLSHRRGRFCPLIEGIVSAGLSYRRQKGNPITRSEAEKLNAVLLRLQFKIPELHSPVFLDALAQDPLLPATEVATPVAAEAERKVRQKSLEALMQDFLSLSSEQNRQRAGIALQRVLQDLFEAHGLQPHGAFRVTGEEIDGSFYFEKESYLLEAKWTVAPTRRAELDAFDAKIRRKSLYTRGVFVSINGYSPDAVDAVRTGGNVRFIMLDGSHLYRVLDGKLSLESLFVRAWRRFAERGEAYSLVVDLSEGPT